MTETTDTPQKKTKKSKTIWALSLLSIAYIGIVYFLINETKVCDDVPISPNSFKGFWDQYLGCRSVNELGDTLAGAFAPVAFLWLMGAVFIQSQELKAQREELDETQEVMRAQLDVARQQVAETKASTELFKLQTEFMNAENKRKLQDERNKVIEETLNYISRTVLNADYYGACKRYNSSDERWHPVPLVSHEKSGGSIDDILEATRRTIEQIIYQHNSPSSEAYIVKHEWFKLIKDEIETIQSYAPELSENARLRLMALFLEPLIEQITKLIETVPDSETPDF